MSRSAALLLSLLLFMAPLPALAGDDAPAADIQGYISAITGDSDENPHSCYEADDEKQDQPDLADRPQS